MHRAPSDAPRRPLHVVSGVVATTVGVVVLLLVPGPSTEAADVGILRTSDALPYVTAHRGESATAPENTMPAFRAAVAHGADLVETDVQLTADRIPVLLHDSTVDRTTDGEGLVGELTFAELRALDAGSWYAPEFAGTRVPLFDELLNYLALEATEVRAVIELKGSWDVDETRLLVSSVRARGLGERVAFASFSEKSLRSLRESGPEFARALLMSELPAQPVAAAQEVGAIAIMTRLDAVRDRPWVVRDLHAAGLSILIYTLNEEELWEAAFRLGVDGIITDRTSGLGSWMAASVTG